MIEVGVYVWINHRLPDKRIAYGRFCKRVSWPALPRKGDGIVLVPMGNDMHSEIREVCWNCMDGTVRVEVTEDFDDALDDFREMYRELKESGFDLIDEMLP